MAEIAFETMRAALEAVRNTPETAPTHLLNIEGTITPKDTKYRAKEQRGTTTKNYRHVITRRWSEIEGKGDLDINEIAFWLNMALVPVTVPTTPGTAVLSRLWTFTRNITADNIKSMTGWWGDPNLNQLQAQFIMLDELDIENDASGDGVATISVKAMGGAVTPVAAPAATTSIAGALLPGQLMQCWIDTSGAIGTTAITDRLVSVKHKIVTGAKQKYIASGPTSTLAPGLIGRDKIVAIETELKFEFLDFTQYDNWKNADSLKVRVRHNGALIETISSTSFYNYVEVDQYGPFDDLSWDDNEGTNRALTLKIMTGYDATLGSDARIAVQNQRTTL